MSVAPYYHNVAAGPPGGSAVWAETNDGVRVRIALWPEGKRGTVVMFPGRTEYIEKYSDAAREFHARGYASAAIDWRGQGLTERPKPNRMTGHVEDYLDYQHDVAALLDVLRAQGFPEPYHLLAHSMGGLIGLRAVMGDHPFASAGFSGPMWGLPLAPHMRLGAWVISHIGHALGKGSQDIPFSGKVADPTAAPFEGNLLTSDPEMFSWMKKQVTTHPDLALGGPSMSWVRTALREMRAIKALPSPDLPCLTICGTNEEIVDIPALRDRMGRWPQGELLMLEGGHHEVLLEAPALRSRAFDALAGLFERASRTA